MPPTTTEAAKHSTPRLLVPTARPHPEQLLPARLEVFRRWPTSTTAAHLSQSAAAVNSWSDLEAEVITALARDPRQVEVFALHQLKDPNLAWRQANDLKLDDDHTWADVVTAYEPIDPVAMFAIHRRLVEHDLTNTGAQHHQHAARRLTRMRHIATNCDQLAEIDAYIAELRELHRLAGCPTLLFNRTRLGRTVPNRLLEYAAGCRAVS